MVLTGRRRRLSPLDAAPARAPAPWAAAADPESGAKVAQGTFGVDAYGIPYGSPKRRMPKPYT